MATITDTRVEPQPFNLLSAIWGLLVALGSLKITVTLFALSLVTVLVGTLAQDEMNMLEVKQRYFLSWFTFLYIDDLFPQAFFPHKEPYPGRIPFLGGACIGFLLMVNLVAAKLTRFKIHASGTAILFGSLFMMLGMVVAGVIIFAGHSADGLQGNLPAGIEYSQFWTAIVVALLMVVAGSIFGVIQASRRSTRILLGITAVACLVFLGYTMVYGRIGDPGLRIVWQLTKGLGAGVVLLVGCQLLFGKQGGNVLLHIGVALLMFGQFIFGDRQLEQRLNLVEGESTNTFVNFDAVELAFVAKGPDQEEVASVPASLLVAAKGGEVIDDPALPVKVKVINYFTNSTFEDDPDNPSTVGLGLRTGAKERAKSGGAESAMNLASAYVELIDKESDEPIGTYLVSQMFSDRKLLLQETSAEDIYDTVAVGDQDYDVGLRFGRVVKPYWVQLEDVRRVEYTGSTMVKDFSSYIRIVDTETGEDRRERVWMNNPLRYRGETFYQENYTPLPGGKELTGIQVVRNSGWLIPYVACSIAALGMLAHFLGTLTRFLERREREAKKEAGIQALTGVPSQKPVWGMIALMALLGGYMLVPWQMAFKSPERDKFDFYTAGQIPVQFGGRMMPLDAYARQTVKSMTNKESIPIDPEDAQQRGRKEEVKAIEAFAERSQNRKLSALQWLMEVASGNTEVRDLPMFRIDAEQIRSELKLGRRENKLYSLADILPNWGNVARQVEVASDKARNAPKTLTFKEKKLLELDGRTRAYTRTAACFQVPTVPEVRPEDFPGADPEMLQVLAIRELEQRMDSLEKMPAPSIVPPTKEDAELAAETTDMPKWSAFAPAYFKHLSKVALADGPDAVEARAGVDPFSKMIEAYAKEDSVAFNQAVEEHLSQVNAYPVPQYKAGLVRLERWMESNSPTMVAEVIYLIALVLGLVYFAVDLPRLRSAVWGTLLIAFAIHTATIYCRILITQRAPVINLYSSAVFIGWAAVLFGLVVDRIFRSGMGNVLAASAGAITLWVAYGLNTGDTMPVLQAVLDTQFWLATHVISVTLGYVATLVAGTLGIVYLIAGWARKSEGAMRDIYRVCYGACCFGILFSFVGTVLGGLWADDSWGRFWGWDPKENGALLIVIWNALMLHARWDGMVKARGFAVLAIFGNIVTAWSWFGTNELGIGLHSYGFTEGALMWLSLFVLTQVLFIIGGIFFWFGPKKGAV